MLLSQNYIFGVVHIAVTERGVAESFLRVKRDVSTLKRNINREILREEELGKAVGQLTTKEEFYAFVRTLKDKLDHLEEQFATKDSVESNEAALRENVRALRKEFTRIDSLRDELLESRKLKDSFARLEAKAVTKAEFLDDLKKINEELSDLKKEVLKTSQYKKYQNDIAELRKSIFSAEKQLIILKEVQNANKKNAEIYKDDVASLRKDMAKNAISITEEIAKLKKAFNDLKGSEVDADELVTKHQLSAVLKIIPTKDNKDDLSKIEKRIKEIEQRILSEGKQTGSDKKIFKEHEQAIAEVRSKVLDMSKKQENRLEELERDVFTAVDATEDSVSKVKNDVNELSKKIDNEVHEVRKDLVEAAKDLVKDLDKKYSQKIQSEITKAQLAPEKDLVAEIDELRRMVDKGAEKVKQEIMKKLDELEERLYAEIEDTADKKIRDLENKFTPVDAFSEDIEKRFKKVEERLEARKDNKAIDQKLQQTEEKSVQKIKEINAKLKDYERKISELAKVKEPLTKANGREYTDIRKEVDYLLNNVVTTPDLDSQAATVEEKLSEFRNELKNSALAAQQRNNELLKKISQLEKKLAEEKKEAKQAEVRGESRKEKPLEEKKEKGDANEGIFKKAFAAVANFFKEDEKEEEPAPKIEVREIEVKEERKIKEEKKRVEKIEEKPNNLKYILIGLIVIIAIGAMAYYLLQPPAVTFTPDEACILNYECKIKEPNQYWFGCTYNASQEACKCFVGAYERCDSAAAAAAEQKRDSARRLPSSVYTLLDYKFYILGVLIVIGLIIYLMTRDPKEKEYDEEEGEPDESLDLDEFLGKKEKKKEKKKEGIGTRIKSFFFEEDDDKKEK